MSEGALSPSRNLFNLAQLSLPCFGALVVNVGPQRIR